jgi:hypothetical protein
MPGCTRFWSADAEGWSLEWADTTQCMGSVSPGCAAVAASDSPFQSQPGPAGLGWQYRPLPPAATAARVRSTCSTMAIAVAAAVATHRRGTVGCRVGTGTTSITCRYNGLRHPEWLAAQGREGAANIDADRILALSPLFPPVDAYVPTSLVSGSDWYGLLAERLAAVDHEGGVTVYALGAADQFPASATGFGAGVRWVLATPGVEPGAEPGAEKEKPNPSLVVSVYHDPGRKMDAVSITTALALAAEQRQVRLDTAMTEVASGDADVATPIFGQAPADAMRVAIGLGVNVDHLSATVTLEDMAPGAISTTLQLPSLPGHRFEVRPAVQQPLVDAGVMGDAPPKVLWRADNGQPLLIETSVSGGRHLRYLDRLSEVADSPLRSEAFPELLLRLLLGETTWQQGYAQAPVDPTLTLTNSGLSPAVPNQPLAPWLALLLALLVAVERWWAERLSAESSQ